MTPDFPKPQAAGRMAWHGTMFAVLAGILFAVFALRIAAPVMEKWGT